MKSVVIVAYGTGQRYGSDKLSEMLLDKKVLRHTVDAFYNLVDEVVIVADSKWKDDFPFAKVVEGGATRTQSVMKGLSALSDKCDLVAIHDGARPFVSKGLVAKLFEVARNTGSAVPSLKVTDTLFRVDDVEPVNRDDYRTVQTPQVFDRRKLCQAYQECIGQFTDDATVYFNKWGSLSLVDGQLSNRKIAYKGDVPQYRTGVGFDVHPLTSGDGIVLGGCRIDCNLHLVGHSDADVVVHAVMDALLSACGLPDIGHLFPDTDSAFKGIDSTKLLEEVMAIISTEGYHVVNVSSVVMAEQPRIAPHIEAMKNRLSSLLDISPDCIGISATTTEKLGIVGEGKGIAVHASALVVKP